MPCAQFPENHYQNQALMLLLEEDGDQPKQTIRVCRVSKNLLFTRPRNKSVPIPAGSPGEYRIVFNINF